MGRFGRRRVGAPGGSDANWANSLGQETFVSRADPWGDAGREFDLLGKTYAEWQRLRRDQEEAERAAEAKRQAKEREQAQENEVATANAEIAEAAAKVTAPTYVPPEGYPQPQTVEEDTLIKEQRADMATEAIEQQRELEETRLEEEAKVRDAEEKTEYSAQVQYEKAQQKKAEAAARAERLRQRKAIQELGQLTDQQRRELAEDRRTWRIEDAIEDAREKLDDDASLYGHAERQVRAAAKERGEKLSKRELDAATRDQMQRLRLESGWYQESASGLVFDPMNSPARAELDKRNPVRPEDFTAPITEEEIAQAEADIRYRMPIKYRDKKAGWWKAQGLSDEEAAEMARWGDVQSGRVMEQEPALAASGRKDPVVASTATAGMGSSNAAPAAPRRRPTPEQGRGTMDASVGGVPTGGVQQPPAAAPAGTPAQAAPPSPAPPTGSSPAAVPPEGTIEPELGTTLPPVMQAMQDPMGVMRAGLEKVGDAVMGAAQGVNEFIGWADVQELADRSNVDKEQREKLFGAIAVMPGMRGNINETLDQLENEEDRKAVEAAAKHKAQTAAGLEGMLNMEADPETKAKMLENYLRGRQLKEYGPRGMEILSDARQAAFEAIRNGANFEESMRAATEQANLGLKNLEQSIRAGELTGEAAEWSAAYEQMIATLSDPKEMGKFMLTTGVPMFAAAVSGALVPSMIIRGAAIMATTAATDAAVQYMENGEVDFRSSLSEGGSALFEAPGMTLVAKIAGKAGNKILGKALKIGAGSVIEGLEEGMQENIGSLIRDGRLSTVAETAVAASLGAMIGPAAGPAVELGGALARAGGGDPASAEALADLTKRVLEANPELAEEIEAGNIDMDEVHASVQAELEAQSLAETAAAEGTDIDMTEATKGLPYAHPRTDQATAPIPGGQEEADLAEQVAAATGEDVDTTPEFDFAGDADAAVEAALAQRAEFEAERQGRVEKSRAALERALPNAEFDETQDDGDTATITATVTRGDGTKVRLQTNLVPGERLVLTTEELVAGHGEAGAAGVAAGEARVSGVYTPIGDQAMLELDADALVEIETGRSDRKVYHEVFHFLRNAGLVSDADYNSLASNARAANPNFKGNAEELVAEAWGEYMEQRAAGKPPTGKRWAPMERLATVITQFREAVVGGDAEIYGRLARGEYAGQEGAGTRAGRKVSEALGRRKPVQKKPTSTENEQKAIVDAKPDGIADWKKRNPELAKRLSEPEIRRKAALEVVSQNGEVIPVRVPSGRQVSKTSARGLLDSLGETAEAEGAGPADATGLQTSENHVIKRGEGGQVLAAARLVERGGVKSPHVVRDVNADTRADMDEVMLELLKKPGWQFQEDTVSKGAAAMWNRLYARGGTTRRLLLEHSPQAVQAMISASSPAGRLLMRTEGPSLSTLAESKAPPAEALRTALRSWLEGGRKASIDWGQGRPTLVKPAAAEKNAGPYRAAAGDPRAPSGRQTIRRPERAPEAPKIRLTRDGKPFVVGVPTTKEWIARVEAWTGKPGSKDFDESFGWYRNLLSEFEKVYGKKAAPKMMLAWGLSQQRASASYGMGNVLKASDIVRGFREEYGTKAGLAHDRLLAALRDSDDLTVGEKLADFVDAIFGSDTRQWVGNDPTGGQPAPFDIWALRDAGFIDKGMLKIIEKHFGKKVSARLKVDSGGSPAPNQYVWGNRFYNRLAQDLNRMEYGGRSDWKAYEVQALGWLTIQRMLGTTPETSADIFMGDPDVTSRTLANTSRVPVEAQPGDGAPLRETWEKIPQSKRAGATRRIALAAAPRAAELAGVALRKKTRTVGGWEQQQNPNVVFEVVGSPKGVERFQKIMAYVMQQTEVWGMRQVKVQHANSFGVDLFPPTGFDFTKPGDVRRFWKRSGLVGVPGLGFSVVDYQDGRPVIRVTLMRDQAALDAGPKVVRLKGRDLDGLAAPMRAALEAGPLDVEAEPRSMQTNITSNDWKENSDGKSHTEGLEGVDRAELDGLARRTAERYRAEAEGRKASLERDTRTEADVLKEDAADTGRRVLTRGKEALKKIKSADGRPVGAQLSEQLRQRREYHERQSSRMSSTFNRALDAFRKAKGRGWQEDWDTVVSALDGETDYASLDRDQQNLYTVTRALLNQAKRDAQREGVFTAQPVSKYFPHVHPDGRLSEDGAIDAHAEWLETTEEGQKRLATLQEEDLAWLSGVLGEEASTRELAQMDLARNFNRQTFWTSNPHLEKHRSSRGLPFRRDPDVIRYYLDKAYDRIATGRYLGVKNEHGMALLRTMKKSDREFAVDVVQDALGLPGGKPRSKLGRLAERGARELSALQGLAKLGMAALPQMTQLASSSAEAIGRQGFVRGISNAVRSATEMFTKTAQVYAEAERAGSTYAATSGESMRSFAGAGQRTFVEALFKRVLGERLVGSTYFVRDLDKAARVVADNAGRAVYLDALRAGDIGTLTDLLGTEELARTAIKEDQGRVDELLKMWKEGRLGDANMRLFQEKKHGAKYPQGVSFDAAAQRLDQAGKRFADKTQYRTFSENEPVGFRSPIVKAANTFYSFHLQHLNWQWDHFKAYKAARRKGDNKGAWQHARTLMSYHMIMAPIIGQLALSIRSLLTGGGLEEKEVDTPGEAWEALFGLDPIKAEDEWTAALRALQGWQFAGGFGYPASIAERTTRAYEKSEYDPGRAFASFAGGAPGETVYDAGTFAANWARYAIKRTQNLDRPSDWDKAVRQSIRMSGHVIPNPFGVASGARRKALEGVGDQDQKRPQTRGGWELLFDPDAYWSPMTGMTTDEIEQNKREARKERAEDREEELDRAEDARRDRGWE